MNVSPELIGDFVIALGVLVIFYVLFVATAKRMKNKRYGKAEAVVGSIKLLPKSGGPEKKIKCPVITFKAKDTDVTTQLFDLACDEDKECSLKEGDTVKIFYEPRRPDRVYPEEDMKPKKGYYIFGFVMGVVVIAIGVYLHTIDLYK